MKMKKWGKKEWILGTLAAGGALAMVSAGKAYRGVMKAVHTKKDVSERIYASFSNHYKYIGEDRKFTGAAIGAVACSLRVDLGKAQITEDVDIELGAFMSAVTIILPKNVNASVECKLNIGGYSVMQDDISQDAPTVHIHGVVTMGALTVLESNLDEIAREEAAAVEEEIPVNVVPIEEETPESKPEEEMIPEDPKADAPESFAKEPAAEEAAVSFMALEDTASMKSDRLSADKVQDILGRIVKENENNQQ